MSHFVTNFCWLSLCSIALGEKFRDCKQNNGDSERHAAIPWSWKRKWETESSNERVTDMQQLHGTWRDYQRQPATIGDNQRHVETLWNWTKQWDTASNHRTQRISLSIIITVTLCLCKIIYVTWLSFPELLYVSYYFPCLLAVFHSLSSPIEFLHFSISHKCWLSLTVTSVPRSCSLSFTIFNGWLVSLSISQFLWSCYMSLTVSYGCWISQTVSRVPWSCYSLLMSPIVAGCLLLSLTVSPVPWTYHMSITVS